MLLWNDTRNKEKIEYEDFLYIKNKSITMSEGIEFCIVYLYYLVIQFD